MVFSLVLQEFAFLDISGAATYRCRSIGWLRLAQQQTLRGSMLSSILRSFSLLLSGLSPPPHAEVFGEGLRQALPQLSFPVFILFFVRVIVDELCNFSEISGPDSGTFK